MLPKRFKTQMCLTLCAFESSQRSRQLLAHLGWQVIGPVGYVISATKRRLLLSHVHLHVREEIHVIAASTPSARTERAYTMYMRVGRGFIADYQRGIIPTHKCERTDKRSAEHRVHSATRKHRNLQGIPLYTRKGCAPATRWDRRY